MNNTDWIYLRHIILIPCKLFDQKLLMINLSSYFLIFITTTSFFINCSPIIFWLVLNILFTTHIFDCLSDLNLKSHFPLFQFSQFVFSCFHSSKVYTFTRTVINIIIPPYLARSFVHPQVLLVVSSKAPSENFQYPSIDPSTSLHSWNS